MSSAHRHVYDNAVGPDNVFGHTLDLLGRHLAGDRPAEAIHLDLACGFGHVATPIETLFGLDYVGVDISTEYMAPLREAGHETHVLDLDRPDLGAALRDVVGGRPIASISMLDGLEHMRDPTHVLAALGELTAEHRAVTVVSVPNVTHIDVGVKTLLGQWSYTESGLLDSTHYQLYSETSLLQVLRRGGLKPFDRHDVVMARSDQHFPLDHVGLNEASTLGQLLRDLRATAEPNHLVNQFVWALGAVPPRETADPVARDTDLFLSVVMRTQGRRPQQLREALLCLAAQTVQDFEVLVVAHRTSVEEQVSVEQVILDQPDHLRDRIELLLLDHGPRAAPLNLAIGRARGRYVAVFDDDDLLLADWVRTFADAERDHRGRILRAVSLRQDAETVSVRDRIGVRAVAAPTSPYDKEFSLAHHLVNNQSPVMTWAFPRSLHADFGLHFDESMTTTEDWEFLLQAAQICGVTDITRVVAVYQWWSDRASSQTAHAPHEWQQNHREVERRVDRRPFILPKGETIGLRRDFDRLAALERETVAQHRRIAALQQEAATLRGRLRRRRQRVEQLKRTLRAERRARRKAARARRSRPVSLPRRVARRIRRAVRR